MLKICIMNDSIYYVACRNLNYQMQHSYKDATIAAVVITSILQPAICISNILIVYIIVKYKSLHTPPYILLLFTAIFDGFTGLFYSVWNYFLCMITFHHRHNCIIYVAASILIRFCGTMSFLTVLLATIDRYIAIFKPFYYESNTNFNKIYIILLCFSSTIILSIHLIANSYNLGFIASITECLIVVTGFASSLLAYIRIFKRVRQTKKQIRCQRVIVNTGSRLNQSTNKIQKMKKERRVTLLMCFVVITLYVSFLPYIITCVLFMLDLPCYERYNIHAAETWGCAIVLLKSLLNPFLYCYSLSSIQKRLFRKNIVIDNEK